jgi:hypothetical protein
LPPEPIAITFVFGLETSPLPVMISEASCRRRISRASRRRRVAVGAPVLGEFDGGADQLPRAFPAWPSKQLEQGEGVGGAAGETGHDLIVVEAAHLARVALDDGVAQRDLAVAADKSRPCLGGVADSSACKVVAPRNRPAVAVTIRKVLRRRMVGLLDESVWCSRALAVYNGR